MGQLINNIIVKWLFKELVGLSFQQSVICNHRFSSKLNFLLPLQTYHSIRTMFGNKFPTINSLHNEPLLHTVPYLLDLCCTFKLYRTVVLFKGFVCVNDFNCNAPLNSTAPFFVNIYH